MAFTYPEADRIAGTQTDDGGLFFWPSPIPGRVLFAIASHGGGWEHVSVRARDGSKDRIPTWEEMCAAKAKFWGAEDVVMQLHPAESSYINVHHAVLHLWRPVGMEIPTPPLEFV